MAEFLPIMCPGHVRPVVGLRYCHTSDNLNLILTSSHDKTAQLRWANDGAWIGSFQGHNGAVWDATLDIAGNKCLTASADFTAKLWDVSTGTMLASMDHKHIVKCTDFSTDTKLFLTAGFEKVAFVFDLETQVLMHSFEHPQMIPKARWLNANEFVTGSSDGMLRKFDVRSPRAAVATTTLFSTSKRGISDIDWNQEEGILVVCSGGKRVSSVDALTLHVQSHVDVSFELESASKKKNLILCGGSQLMVVHDTTHEQVAVFNGHHGPVFACRFDPKSVNALASGSGDATIRIWKM